MFNFDLDELERLNDFINENKIFSRKIIVKKNKNKQQKYQIYNQLCVCIVRIRETVRYLADFNFKKENTHGQAFDFYEFINCISIVLGCTESLFNIFGENLTSYYKGKQVFLKSNKSNQGDIKFFKFVRSAAAVHPSGTTKHNEVTKLKFEVYPYALWLGNKISLIQGAPKDADIELIGWNSKTKSFNKYYYFYINEFYDFTNCLIKIIYNLFPAAQKIVDLNREKERCKVIKAADQFRNYSDYLLYLRERLKRKNKSEEFADGGLLLASHIIANTLIGNEFKNYIKQRVNILVGVMKRDVEEISFDDIFDELSLYELIKDWDKDSGYISEKFNIYLHQQVLNEIENNEYEDIANSFITYNNNLKYSRAEWAVHLLCPIWDRLFKNVDTSKAKCFADIYELALEEIYLQLHRK